MMILIVRCLHDYKFFERKAMDLSMSCFCNTGSSFYQTIRANGHYYAFFRSTEHAKNNVCIFPEFLKNMFQSDKAVLGAATWT